MLALMLMLWWGGVERFLPATPTTPVDETRPYVVDTRAATYPTKKTLFLSRFLRTVIRYVDHGWGAAAIDSKTWEERFARTMGQLANVTMGLTILPVLRNGVFEKVRRFRSFILFFGENCVVCLAGVDIRTCWCCWCCCRVSEGKIYHHGRMLWVWGAGNVVGILWGIWGLLLCPFESPGRGWAGCARLW